MISNRVETFQFHVNVSFGVLVWASFSRARGGFLRRTIGILQYKGNISKCFEIALRLGKPSLLYHYLSPVRVTLKEITN